VTAEITGAFGIASIVTPVTDDSLRTKVVIAGEGEIDFQDYFVRRRHAVPVTSVRLAGAERARPAPGVLAAIAEAEAIVVAPSNPIVSIAPVLAVQGLREAVIARRDRVVAISPIIAGAALKGPADRLLVELGHESSVIGVAGLYAEIASVLVIDNADAAHTKAVEAKGMRCVVTDTIMSSAERAGALAKVAVASVGVEV
jgi:LPPG:FO 2-phospho-L-lactate transferase